MKNAIELYERALAQSGGLGAPRTARFRFEDGSQVPLHAARYMGAADPLDHRLLADVAGPVLDVGCGPGRHLRALTVEGVYALGVDLSPAAVEYARRDGAQAVVADVFGEVPGAGEWATALLLDGNIGIGGDPRRLLTRLGTLLCEGGVVLVELESPDTVSASALARIETDAHTSDWFAWARVSVAEIESIAAEAGMRVEATWQCGERWFSRLLWHSAG